MNAKLTKWQSQVAKDKVRFKVLCCGRRAGKALDVETPIPTPNGFKRLLDIKVGDYVFTETGEQTKVLYKSQVYTQRDCYEVLFSDGANIIADAEHDWVVETKSYRKNKARTSHTSITKEKKTTAELLEHLYIHRKDGGKETNYSIPVAGELKVKPKKLRLDPYFMGLWLGDGTSCASHITNKDEEVVKYIYEYAEKLGMKVAVKDAGGMSKTYRISKKKRGNGWSIQKELRSLNLIGNKHIPKEYLWASVNQRKELLRGIIDTDGYVNVTGQCEISTKSKILARDIKTLVVGLGMKAVIGDNKSTLYGRYIGRRYRIKFSLIESISHLKPYNSKRKADTARRFIVSINKVKSVPVQCLMVDSKSHLFLAGESMVATHNTTLSVWELVARAGIHKDYRAAYLAPTYQQARDIAWAELKRIANPITKEVNESRLEIVLNNGSSVVLRGWESVETLRGQSFDFLVVDEIASMRNWEYNWNEVLRPTLTDRKGEALFISTPRGYNHFYDLYNKEQTDKDYKSYHFTSYDNPYLPLEELEKAKKELSEEQFAQEYLADFRKTEGLAHKYWNREIHLIPPFVVPSEWVRIRGFDYGSDDPTASVRIAIDGENNWFVERSYKDRRRTIKEHAEAIKAQDVDFGLVPAWGDPSGGQWFNEFSQYNLHITPANREKGKEKSWVKFCVEKVNQLLKSQPGHRVLLQGNEIQNAPHLFVLDTEENKDFVSEIELLRWKETHTGKSLDSLDEEVDPNGHSDLMAALRYAVVSYEPIKPYTPARQNWSLA